jgi:3-hydroxybutyrate dehydrogenase
VLKNKSAVVTGSTSGIGLGIAKGLARQGVNILINGFGEADALRAMCSEMAQEFGVKVIYSGADMSRPAEIREMVRHAASEFGGLDILVNNAGIQYTETVDDFPEEKWDAILAINLSANFHAIKAALPYMKEKNWGRIINTASVHGLVGSGNKSAYVAAKHGVIGLTKVVALENASTGITCNAICPGWVLTALVQRQIDDLAAKESISQAEAQARLVQAKQPSGNFATPEQIAELALFICSDAASEMRGTSFAIDGGWTAQ